MKTPEPPSRCEEQYYFDAYACETFSSVQSLSRVQLFATPWIAACQAMAPHSSTLAGKLPWTEEPGRLQSMGSLRVGHDWATSLSLFTFMDWRRKWQPTPVLLPGNSHRQRGLADYSPWGHKGSNMTERPNTQTVFHSGCANLHSHQ